MASRGDELAKRTLWEVVITDRKRILFAKLKDRGVREADWKDAHSNTALRVYIKIEQLKVTRAYCAWEEKLLRSECRLWIRDYAIVSATLETVETTTAEV